MPGILANELRDHVIRPCLQTLNLASPAAENLLLGTAAQESRLGHYLKQQHGPALGIYQIETATHDDVWQNYLRYNKRLAKQLINLLPKKLTYRTKQQALISNLLYATAIARIIYYRASEPLPDANNIEGLAQYWKTHYNTAEGSGTVDEFIQHYHEYVWTPLKTS